MYEEKPKKNLNINWKPLLIKLAILLVVVFIVILIVSLVKKDNKTSESNFTSNLQTMRTSAKEYFTGSRLPSNINGRKKITLGEMLENHLVPNFSDQSTCDTIGSYAEATKINGTDYTIKVKLVCGKEDDYIIDTIKVEDEKINVPTDNNGNVINDNQNNNDNNNSNNSNVSKPNNSGTTSKPGTSTSTNKPSTNTTNKPNTNTVVNKTCTYGNKEYTSTYPLVYVIPGNCAVSESDFYKAEYANKVSSIAAAEYKKLNNEVLALKAKTGADLYTEVPTYSGIKNKTGEGLVGYQVLFTMKQKKNYTVMTVYQYYLDSNGNRTVVIDKRNSISSSNENNNGSTGVIRVSNITLNRSTIYLDVNESFNLIATIMPSNATNKNVSWKSSNTKIATVNSNGRVTALKAGNATITATADGKSVSARVYVNSNTIPVSNVTLNKTYLDLNINESYRLSTTITPSNATNKNVSWKSSNINVATVSSNGTVTAHRSGVTVITAMADGVSASATIYVNNVIPVTNITISKSSLNLYKGNSYTLKATVTPSYATNKSVYWSSSNTNVATVDSNGTVTAKNPGSALIRASADGITASIWVYVENYTKGAYCKVKTQTDYFMGVEQINRYSKASYKLSYNNTDMRDVTVINAGYLYDDNTIYNYARTYFNNPKVAVVTSYNYLNNMPTNYKNFALKKENFNHSISRAYQENGRWYINVSYEVNNYNNVYSHYSNYAGNYIYYIPLFFQIEYTDPNECISVNEYKNVTRPIEWKYVEYIG